MPVSFNSPPRNFFLLGSGAQQALTNFFHTVNRTTGTDRFTASDIAYSQTDQKYILAGSAKDSNSVSFGWLEKQDYDETVTPPSNVQAWRQIFESTLSPKKDVTLNFMKQTDDYGGDIIIGGKVNDIPWVARYDTNGAQQWVSSSFTGDLEYFGIACTSSGYYACGHRTDTTGLLGIVESGFVEKWSNNGIPQWGKSAVHVNGSVKYNALAANDRGEVVVVGAVTDQAYVQGYVAKLDSNTGDVLWDKTINSGRIPFGFGSRNDVEVKNVYIDGKDQVYVVGTEFGDTVPVYQKGFIIKYSAEGNLIWHKTTPSNENQDFLDLWSDTPVEQTVVLSRETTPANGNTNLQLLKYSKNGDIVFKRRIITDTNFVQPIAGLDGDPSFYYMLFVENQDDVSAGTSDTYTFGQVSASGNGFGDFVYDTNFSSREIDYTVNTSGNPIGRLADGSVRNDSSDFISYPYSGLNLLLGDDLATNVSYKKTRHRDKDLFEYSGSPAQRPVDFPTLDIGSIAETTSSTTTTTTTTSATDQQEYTTPGTYSWTAPSDVTSVSVVAIGGGGGGYGNTAGGGGGLGWKNNISVTPGTSYTVVVGDHGVNSAYPASYGEDSYFINTSTVKGGRGHGGGPYADGGVQENGDGFGGDYVGDGGGNGGNGGSGSSNGGFGGTAGGGGGGGAGGYSGNGGDGGFATSAGASGSGGSGGGGGGGGTQNWPNNQQGGSGGGVSIYGEGSSGTGGVFGTPTASGGTGGSGGNTGDSGGTQGNCNAGGPSGSNGNYGGGGGSGNNGNCARSGQHGAVRIIWGTGRSFPSTLTADQTPSSGGTTTTTTTTTNTTIFDQSGNGNNLTANGATLNSSGYWEFDGVDDDLDGPPCNTILSAESSIELWVNFDDVSTRQTIISGYISTTPTETNRWDFEVNNSRIQGGFHGNGYFTSGGSTLNTNNWYHLTFVLSSNTLKFYLNGEENTSQSCSGFNFGGPTIELGIGDRNNSSIGHLNGKVGEVRIYKKTLTEAEVFQNYNATKFIYTGIRPYSGAPIAPGFARTLPAPVASYAFNNALCIPRSANISPSTYETIVSGTTKNGAAYGGSDAVATGFGKVVVGARGDDNGIYTNGGRVFVYNTDGTGQIIITPSGPVGNDMYFGTAVDICDCNGKIAVTSASSLHIFDADGTGEILIDSNSTLPILPPGGLTFGNSVAISGDRVWVSDVNVPTGPNNNGTVYCFDVNTGAFLYQLRPKKTTGFFNYGSVIQANDNILVVGSDSNHSVTNRLNTGRLYLYRQDGTNERIIEPNELTTGSLFGLEGIAIGRGLILAGAPRQQRTEDPNLIGSGEVFAFDYKGNKKFSVRPSDDPANENLNGMGFGGGIAISSDRVFIGAEYFQSGGGFAGKVYMFSQDGTKELQSFQGSNTIAGDNFGTSASASGGTLVIGSPTAGNSGKAYIYPVTNTISNTVQNLTNIQSTLGNAIIVGATFDSSGYLIFDGSNDYLNLDVNTGAITLTEADGWALEGWFRFPDPASNNAAGTWNYLFRDNISGGPVWEVGMFGANNSFEIKDNNSQERLFFNTTPNTWHFICLGIDQNGKLFLKNSNSDGSFSTQQSSGAASSGDVQIVKLFCNQSGSQCLNAHCGEIRIYDREIITPEFTVNYNATRKNYGI